MTAPGSEIRMPNSNDGAISYFHGAAAWPKIWPDLQIRIEPNGHALCIMCEKYRIFCLRPGIETIGL